MAVLIVASRFQTSLALLVWKAQKDTVTKRMKDYVQFLPISCSFVRESFRGSEARRSCCTCFQDSLSRLMRREKQPQSRHQATHARSHKLHEVYCLAHPRSIPIALQPMIELTREYGSKGLCALHYLHLSAHLEMT